MRKTYKRGVTMLKDTGFDKWAGDYDESISQYLDKFPFDGYYQVLSTVHTLVEPSKEIKILDVGIGTGLLSHELWKNDCQIYGVDFSKKMIEKAREKMRNGTFVIADVAKDHLGELNHEKFNRIISSYFFHHLNLKQKIEFIKRSFNNNLYPNGIIIIADVGFATKNDFINAHEANKEAWDEDEWTSPKRLELIKEIG